MRFAKRLEDNSIAVAIADLTKIGNQDPYFSLTYENRKQDHWGAAHTTIVEHFPHLEFMVKWHLSTDGIPMHYVENSIYWYYTYKGVSEFERKSYDPDPLQAFYSTCCWGVSRLDKPETSA